MCIHRLVNHIPNFVDVVSHKIVYNAECSKCGGVFMTDSLRKYFSYKVPKRLLPFGGEHATRI